jgi:hypothetical protein
LSATPSSSTTGTTRPLSLPAPGPTGSFELGEEPPRDDGEKIPFPFRQAIRLAELGDLQPEEVAALAERAAKAKARIDKGWHYEHISALGTDMERFTDRETVAAWEKVEKALKR